MFGLEYNPPANARYNITESERVRLTSHDRKLWRYWAVVVYPWRNELEETERGKFYFARTKDRDHFVVTFGAVKSKPKIVTGQVEEVLNA